MSASAERVSQKLVKTHWRPGRRHVTPAGKSSTNAIQTVNGDGMEYATRNTVRRTSRPELRSKADTVHVWWLIIKATGLFFKILLIITFRTNLILTVMLQYSWTTDL